MLQNIERKTILVPLSGSNGGSALVDLADYEQLLAAGLSQTWFYNANGRGSNFYVRADQRNASGKLVGVARLIAGAGRGEVVKYRDRDTRNLTRSNLYLAKGRALRNDELIVNSGPRPTAPTLTSPAS